ncbi:MAG: Hsp20/alpha crystallin family protein [Labilithrix sp.]|nr:Hsp20/alpha crystallin family protein [Labilithrix sp.]
MNEIDHAIGTVDRLYRAVTGRDAPELTGVYAAIPAEKDPIEHVNEQMELLARALGGAAPAPMRQFFTPPMSVWMGPHEHALLIDLPGVRREDLQLTIEGRVLVIAGARRSISDPTTPFRPTEGSHRVMMSEHAFGAFVRRIPLPPTCRVEEINARLHDGVLEIHLPHDSAAAPRRAISVSS